VPGPSAPGPAPECLSASRSEYSKARVQADIYAETVRHAGLLRVTLRWQWLTASAALTRLPMCRIVLQKMEDVSTPLVLTTSKREVLWTTIEERQLFAARISGDWGRRRLRLPECYRLTQPPRSRNRIPPKTIAAPGAPGPGNKPLERSESGLFLPATLRRWRSTDLQISLRTLS